MQDREAFFDVIKGIAILAVVLTHTYIIRTEVDPIFVILYKNFLTPAVPVFFMISGILVNQKKVAASPNRWVIGRIYRLGVPFMFWTLVFVSMNVFALHGFSGAWSCFLKILSGGNLLYFIILLIEYSCLTPVLIKLVKTKYWWIAIILSVLYCSSSYFIKYIRARTGITINMQWFYSEINGLSFIGYYVLGLRCHNSVTVKRVLKQKNRRIMAIIITFIFWILLFAEGLFWYKYVSLSAAASATRLTAFPFNIGLFIILLYYRNNINLKMKLGGALIWLGQNSFPIYFMHTILYYISSVPVFMIINRISFLDNVFVQSIFNSCLILGMCYLIILFVNRFIKNKTIKAIIGFN